MSSQSTVLTLYRRILRAAQSFPSIKRDSIIRDIKTEFREHRALTDEAVIQQRIQVAQRSLEDLESYAGMSKGGPDISHTLRGSCT